MADFMLHRKISVDTYPFPEGAFKIYGDGKFYNGFAIGASNKLTVVNQDGLLKFSRGAAESQEHTSVILGTMPKNTTQRIYVDVAVGVTVSTWIPSYFKINDRSIFIGKLDKVDIHSTTGGPDDPDTIALQAGGVVTLYFTSSDALPAIPNLCSVRAIWTL